MVKYKILLTLFLTLSSLALVQTSEAITWCLQRPCDTTNWGACHEWEGLAFTDCPAGSSPSCTNAAPWFCFIEGQQGSWTCPREGLQCTSTYGYSQSDYYSQSNYYGYSQGIYVGYGYSQSNYNVYSQGAYYAYTQSQYIAGDATLTFTASGPGTAVLTSPFTYGCRNATCSLTVPTGTFISINASPDANSTYSWVSICPGTGGGATCSGNIPGNVSAGINFSYTYSQSNYYGYSQSVYYGYSQANYYTQSSYYAYSQSSYYAQSSYVPPTTPVMNSVTVSSPTVRPDNSTQYTITVTASDAGGPDRIRHERALINHQGDRAGQYRGYLAMSFASNAWAGHQDNRACTGGGWGAIGSLAPDNTFGHQYIHLDQCFVSTVGASRITEFVVRLDPLFTTPLTNNDISGYVENDIANNSGWVNFDVNFGLILPTLSASPASMPAGQSAAAVWTGSIDNRDWVGVYAVGAADNAFISRVYANNCTAFPGTPGAVTSSGSCNFTMNTPGTYEFRMFANGTMNKIATSNQFTVTPSTTITITINGPGSVSDGTQNCVGPAVCSRTYTTGSTVTFTGTPSAGGSFGNWGGACAGAGSNPVCSIVINSGSNVTANFAATAACTVNVQSIPTLNVTTVRVNNSNYCGSGVHATVEWTYFDSAGSPQTAYEVQINDSWTGFGTPAPLGPPEWESGVVLGDGSSASTTNCPVDNSTNTTLNPVASPQTSCRMVWNTAYRAWARVRNGFGQWSQWILMDRYANGPVCNGATCPNPCVGFSSCNYAATTSWITPRHAFPQTSFNVSPPNPAINVPTTFSDSTAFGLGSVNREWVWNFGGGTPGTEIGQGPHVNTYTTVGTYSASLTASDDVGSCTATTQILNVQKIIPRWREVAPR